MLNDVERRAFLVEPARKDPLPRAPRLLDVELNESAGEPLILPRRGRVARAQANHRVAQADRLSGLERDVADDAVALVEKSEHRDPLAHRGYAGHGLGRARGIDGDRGGAIGGLRALRSAITAAHGRSYRRDRQRPQARARDYSGFHA